MSWNAYLTDDRGHCEGSWNYTHNTSVMIYEALRTLDIELPPSTRPCQRYNHATQRWEHHPDGCGPVSWWEHLNGMSGPEGAEYLYSIVRELEFHPMKYRAMDPPNGWGDYDGIVKTLHEMVLAVPEWPTTWSASG